MLSAVFLKSWRTSELKESKTCTLLFSSSSLLFDRNIQLLNLLGAAPVMLIWQERPPVHYVWVSVNSHGLFPVVELLENKPHCLCEIPDSSAKKFLNILFLGTILLALNLWERKTLGRVVTMPEGIQFWCRDWGACPFMVETVFLLSIKRSSVIDKPRFETQFLG